MVLFIRPDNNLLEAKIGTKEYLLMVADNQTTREKGLSGTSSLKQNLGMLFIFDKSSTDKSCIWMKDMTYDIDILWFNDEMKLVDLKTNVLAGSYPEVYCPKVPAKYVVELNSGQAGESGIMLGQELSIKKQ